MNARVQWLVVLAIVAAGARTAAAVEADARANLCPRGQETWVCSDAYTQLDWFEAAFSDEVDVSAYFVGPGYYWTASDTKVPTVLNPATWRASVGYDSICAFSGLHTAEGLHRAWVDSDGTLVVWDEQISLSYYYNPYCDCQGEIP